MNKKIVVIAVSLVWVATAAWMVVSKQHTLKTGKKIILETAPIDPRDLLRGDYVVLAYKISTLSLDEIPSEKASYAPGDVIYVRLEPAEAYWKPVNIGTKKCGDESVCIRGKIQVAYPRRLVVTYGIESYFVPEGEGKELEKRTSRTDAPMGVEVIVDASGQAVIQNIPLS